MSFFLRRFIFIKHTKKQGGYIMRENIKTGIKYLALFGMCFLGGRSLAAGQTVRVDGEKPCISQTANRADRQDRFCP